MAESTEMAEMNPKMRKASERNTANTLSRQDSLPQQKAERSLSKQETLPFDLGTVKFNEAEKRLFIAVREGDTHQAKEILINCGVS